MQNKKYLQFLVSEILITSAKVRSRIVSTHTAVSEGPVVRIPVGVVSTNI